ncbi:hypothetical protein MX850_03010 [Erysipelothrix sp. Poltava]|nr:hypothetical protein MX850_03010 [Erysipelothrix sp. Poltava]
MSIRDQPIEAKQQFGYVSDDPNAFLKLKGIEYLNFIADIYNINELDRQKRIQNYTQTPWNG